MDPLSLLMMAAPMIGGMFSGGGGSKGEMSSTYSPGAQSLLDQAIGAVKGMKGGENIAQNQNYQQGQNWLQDLFSDPNFFENFEAPMQRQFQEQTVPDLANRFASMGSGGSLGSTGFRNQLAREGSNLHTNIAAMRGGMQQQGVNQGLQYAQQPFNNLMQLYGIGTTPTQNVYQGPTASPTQNILSGLTGGMAQGFGNQFGQWSANNMMGGNRNPGQSPSTY